MSEVDLTLTKAAIEHVKRSIAKRGKGLGIRLGIKTTGCSGLAYVLEYADEARPEDKKFPCTEGLSVYVDPKAFEYLKGSTLDYAKKGLNEGFEFINPNEKSRCGCGESFHV